MGQESVEPGDVLAEPGEVLTELEKRRRAGAKRIRAEFDEAMKKAQEAYGQPKLYSATEVDFEVAREQLEVAQDALVRGKNYFTPGEYDAREKEVKSMTKLVDARYAEWTAIQADKARARAPKEAPDVIWAKKFVVLDDSGKVRAVLGTTPRGVELALLDDKGKLRAALSMIPNGPGLALFDGNGNPRAALAAAGVGGGGALHLWDKDDNELVPVTGPAKDESVESSPLDARCTSSATMVIRGR